ncbi:DUF397 domain-containing protein [Amycolatopsis marina]|uniref:DUF397 domain-containing protein n=1 Tax=Amycolatopsis marina TaxID=490629 RepID=UPI001FE9A0A3|nr:DUF397 domain-containing protein [Amycolatopsis marina]
MRDIGPEDLIWRRSSHSGGGNDCVEVAFHEGRAALRDSKDPRSGMLVTGRSGWLAMLAVVRATAVPGRG